jgi:hypothetical protein
MKKIRILFLIILCLCLFPGQGFCLERGLSSVVKHLDEQITVGTQYLLIIAINEYEHWAPLQNPVNDGRDIKDILQTRYYVDKVIELYNTDATKRNILHTFAHLQEILTPGDSLLIFYAGHGYKDEKASEGYWIPVDGGKDTVARANWLSNRDILDSISGIKSTHICLLADACFSGSLLDLERDHTEIPDPSDIPYYRKAYKRTSRQVITSGAVETVPDTSEFARQLKLVLEKNTATFLDPVMLYDEVRLGVHGTLPLYGYLKDTGHQEGGAFILFLRDRLGAIKIRTTEAGTLYLNGTIFKEVQAGDVLIQNLDRGTYVVTFNTPDGRTEDTTLDVAPGGIAEVSFHLPPPGVPTFTIGCAAGGGFPFLADMETLASPSFGGDLASRLTLLRWPSFGLALHLGTRCMYDTITSDYGFINHMLFIGPYAGISGGMVMPAIEGFFLWADAAGGTGYSRFIHEEYEEDIYSWDPYITGSLTLQKRVGKFLGVSLQLSYTGIFYVEQMYHELLFGVGIEGVF